MALDTAREGIQQIDIVPDLERVTARARIVHGRGDAIIPWRHALNAPPSIAFHLVPEAGHMPQWESSALVTSILSELCEVTS